MFRTVRRTITTLAALCVAATTVLATAPVASAHDELLSSKPANGKTVNTPPGQIVLNFSADLILTGAQIAVTDATGTQVPTGEVAVDGPQVTASLPADMAAGGYDVTWRVVSSDGHPIDGDFTFEIAATDTTPSPTPTDSDTQPDDAATAGPDPAATADQTEEPSTELAIDPPESTENANSVSPTVLWLFGGAIVTLLITLAVLTAITKRRERNQEQK